MLRYLSLCPTAPFSRLYYPKESRGHIGKRRGDLVPVLVEAVKEQQKQREVDRVEIIELKARNAELEAPLERIEAALCSQK